MPDFSTDNLQLACFLLTRKHQFLKSEPISGQEGRHLVRFFFEPSPSWTHDVNDFWDNGQTKVGSYNLAMKRLKSEIRKHFGAPPRLVSVQPKEK